MSGSTTVVAASLDAAEVEAVLAVVADWTAAGLVHPSLWLDAGASDDVVIVDTSGRRRAPAEEWFARAALTRVRVVVLQVVGGAQPRDVVGAATSRVGRLGLGQHPMVNLVVPGAVDTLVPVSALLDSRLNVMLQARDSQAPGTTSQALPAEHLAMHAAAGLATVGGLWGGMAAAPFDDVPATSGRQVALGRAHTRVLTSQAVLDGLSAAVFRSEGALPRARDAAGHRLNEVATAQGPATAHQAAMGVLGLHAGLTVFREPDPYRPAPQTAVGLLAALRMFFSFLVSAIRSAPRAWVESQVRAVSRRAASAATNALYGANSQYQVVVRGVRPSGQSSTDEDDVSALITSAQQLSALVSPGTTFTVPDTAALWQDVVAVGTSLADGGPVDQAVPMPMIGVDRQLMTEPGLIAEPPGAPAHALPTGLLPGVGALTAAVDDPYVAVQAYRLVEEQLQATPAGEQSTVGLLNATRKSLTAWITDRRTYAWHIGLHLAQQVERARAVLAEALRDEQGGAASAPADVLRTQGKVRTTVLALLAGAVLLCVAAVVLAVTAVLSAVVAGVLVLVVLLGWLGSSVLVFLKGQRALFRWLHERDEQRRRQEWALAAAAQVTTELHRLGVLYRQSRYWARVLGTVVHDPFGVTEARANGDAYPAGLTGELPLSVALGVADFDDDRHGQLAHDARRALLGVGWLRRQAARRLELALDARSRRFRNAEHELVWRDTVESPDGPLADLDRSLGSSAERARAAVQVDGLLVDWLAARSADQGAATTLDDVQPVVTVTAGSAAAASGASFVDPLLRKVSQLDPDGLTDDGQVHRSQFVARTVVAARGVPVTDGSITQLPVDPGVGRSGLDRFVARLDLTEPLPPSRLVAFATTGSADRTAPAPVPAPMTSIPDEV